MVNKAKGFGFIKVCGERANQYFRVQDMPPEGREPGRVVRFETQLNQRGRTQAAPILVRSRTFSNPLRASVEAALGDEVTIRVLPRGLRTHFQMQGGCEAKVRRWRDRLLELLKCDSYDHDQLPLLFTPLGVEHRKELKVPGCLVEDRRSQTLTVFGSELERRESCAALDDLVEKLKSQPCRRFILHHWIAKTLRGAAGVSKAEALTKDLKAVGAVAVDAWGSVLRVWGSNEALGRVADELGPRGRGWLKQPAQEGSTCFLCQDQFDPEVTQLRSCGHRFCADCIRGYFSDPSEASLPLRCPMVDGEKRCQDVLVWADVLAVCEKLHLVKRFALRRYLRECEDAECCPAPGCNHVLKKFPAQQFCEMCRATYCMHCSRQLDRAVSAHGDLPCAIAQTGGVDEVHAHRKYIIDNILTLRCPRCFLAFLDYEGCAALECGGCHAHFCAKCFSLSQSSAACHDHAASCPGPVLPNGRRVAAPAGLFLDKEAFQRVCMEVQSARVTDYVARLGPEMRLAVVQQCQEDFLGRPGGTIAVR